VRTSPGDADRVTQTGEIQQRPGARRLRCEAVEDLADEEVAFVWRARFPLLGPLALEIVDELSHGAGRLRVSLLGVPLRTETGPETSLGQAIRYLAELPWAPQAMVGNRTLARHEAGTGRIEVTTPAGPADATVSFELDEDGDVVRATGMRPLRGEDGAFRPTRWGGDFSEYTRFGATRIPAAAETWWEPPEGRFVYWRGRLTEVEQQKRST
jgi:hypothetical protein